MVSLVRMPTVEKDNVSQGILWRDGVEMHCIRYEKNGPDMPAFLKHVSYIGDDFAQ